VNISRPFRSNDQLWPAALSLSRLSAPTSTMITIRAAWKKAVASHPAMAGRLKYRLRWPAGSTQEGQHPPRQELPL
jgi:hypothetical protein